MTMAMSNKVEMELIKTNLRRYTFECPKIKQWVEDNSFGPTLNLFAGKVVLNIDEVRNDLELTMVAEYHEDSLDFVMNWSGHKFTTVILDPPYSYRKSMEMYNGHRNSRFKRVADELPRILHPYARVISFGYHSTFMGKIRGFDLIKMCVLAHGGAQHCTIAIVEKQLVRGRG